jgi:hypothetical protein
MLWYVQYQITQALATMASRVNNAMELHQRTLCDSTGKKIVICPVTIPFLVVWFMLEAGLGTICSASLYSTWWSGPKRISLTGLA